MRRAAIAAACVTLAAVLLAPSAGSAQQSGSPYLRIASIKAAAPCVVWKKHHRRVVKRVRRDGELKRVVKIKRWRTCARRAAPAVPVLPPVTPPAPAPQPEPEDLSIPRLGVKAVEWSYTLSRPEVPAGEVVVELNNMGEDPHNLNLQLEDGSGPEGKITTIGPSSQGKAKFNLPAGTYRLWCDLSEHEERGMKATLIVAPQ